MEEGGRGWCFKRKLDTRGLLKDGKDLDKCLELDENIEKKWMGGCFGGAAEYGGGRRRS